MLPNQEQAKSLLRQILLFGGGFVVSRGYIKAETLEAILSNDVVLGLAVTAFASFWAFLSRSNKNLAIAVTKVDPGATVVVSDPAIAASTPNAPNIVAKEDVKVVAK